MKTITVLQRTYKNYIFYKWVFKKQKQKTKIFLKIVLC